MTCNEFEIIRNYLIRKNDNVKFQAELGIGDDCALINIPQEHTLAITTDTLVEGIHFFSNIAPSDLGYKSLAVNLSDVAAMGADPAWLTLALTLPKIDDDWLKKFSKGFFELIEHYNLQLIGGDITRGHLSLSITVYGLLPSGCALKRSGAKIGDWIFVTGTLGDSAAGLYLLQHPDFILKNKSIHKKLIQRHLRPNPRVLLGQALRNIANSMIDLSDGLIADLNHILIASVVGAKINVDNIPCSSILRNNFTPNQIMNWTLNGGEDYELCFTVSESNHHHLSKALNHLDINYTCIGEILPEKKGLVILKEGNPILFQYKGFDHFDK